MIVKGYRLTSARKDKIQVRLLDKVKMNGCHEITPVELADGNYFLPLALLKAHRKAIEGFLIRKGRTQVIEWLKTHVIEIDTEVDFPKVV